jgi:acyl carrier protein
MCAAFAPILISIQVHGSLNLHNFLPKDLDFFVLLSSTLAVMGYRGQANYQAGNVFQDALAHHRFAQGLPALSINIGVVPDAGWISEHRETSEHNLRIAGLRESPISHITAVMAEWSSSDPQSAHVIMGLPTDHVGEPFYWMQPARFNTLRATKKRYKVTTSGRAEDTARPLLRDELSQAPSLQVATRVMMGRLSEWLARLMMVPIEDIDPQKPLTSYGIDSLVAVEFRNWIVKETGFDLTNLDIMRSVPMTQLGQEIAKKFKVGRNGDIDQGKEENNE